MLELNHVEMVDPHPCGLCPVSHVHERPQKSGEDTKKEKEHLIATGEMVKDPVCGAYIDSDSNITVRDGKTVHRFCSYDCRDEFLKRIGKLPEKTGGDDDE